MESITRHPYVLSAFNRRVTPRSQDANGGIKLALKCKKSRCTQYKRNENKACGLARNVGKRMAAILARLLEHHMCRAIRLATQAERNNSCTTCFFLFQNIPIYRTIVSYRPLPPRHKENNKLCQSYRVLTYTKAYILGQLRVDLLNEG